MRRFWQAGPMPPHMREEPQLVDPLEASRHPFEVYLLILSGLSGLPLLFGHPNSGAIEANLPPLLTVCWGAMLLVGSVFALLGLYWRGHTATGLLLERAGLIGVGGAAIIYATVLLLADPTWDTVYAACLTAGFGFACFAQSRRIARRIRSVLAQVAGNG